MKNTFLITAAAAALVTAAGIASAQSTMEQRLPAVGQQKAQDLKASESVERKTKADVQKKASQKPAASAQIEEKAGVKVETSGQAAPPKTQDAQKDDSSTAQSKSPSEPKAQTGTAAQSDTKSGSSATSAQTGSGASGASASINLTADQKTRIRETVIRSSSAPRLSNVDFSLTVGTIVPKRVRFAPLPRLIVEIHPAWRGYEYFLVGDQIIVVEPRTLRIVAILSV